VYEGDRYVARILVIDPDACLRNLLREVLQHAGYDVVEAHNSYEGLRREEMEPAELMQTDIMYLVAF
jgi:DNA-binding response OmpR family regulator